VLTQKNHQLYLAPDSLTANEANEKARPTETPDQRKARVKTMATSIADAGKQLVPVLVAEVDNGDDTYSYEYVDGGARVDAVKLIREHPDDFADGHAPGWAASLEVWCVLADPDVDLFRQAIVSNLHRTQNSLLDMASICREVRERNGWSGHGAQTKVAGYLGLLPSRVSEYEKLLMAPNSLVRRIQSGEVQTLDVALRLMSPSIPEDKREQVAERASELAAEEVEDTELDDPEDILAEDAGLTIITPKTSDEPDGQAGNSRAGKTAAQGGSSKPAPKADKPKPKPKVQAKHVREAAREVGVKGAVTARTRDEIVTGLAKLGAKAGTKGQVLVWLAKEWCTGQKSDKEALRVVNAGRAVFSPVKPAPKKASKPAKTKKAAKPKRKAAKKLNSRYVKRPPSKTTAT
jgi:hypothetical protein